MPTELGTFLRARRQQVAPHDPAYRPTGRRRIAGLRREEVAAAAGISVDYYTRLEQGRERNPGDAVLASLGRVLGLEADAVEHMRRLRAVSTSPGASVPEQPAEVLRRMTALVEAVRPHPAYVLDALSNVVTINADALALFDGLAQEPADRRNTCRYVFTHPRAREVFPDWETIAWGSVAQLRAANAERLDSADLAAMVRDLEAVSDDFGRWWRGHDVAKRRSSAQRRVATGDEVRTYQYEVLHLPDEGLRLSLYVETPDRSAPTTV